jgi:hypothetical protein
VSGSRAECHVIAAEELVPWLDETGGIEERRYELALTSMRLETRRRVAVSTTSPGDVDMWPYRRWIEGGGGPGCVRCDVPSSAGSPARKSPRCDGGKYGGSNQTRRAEFRGTSPRNFAGQNVISWRRHEIRSAPPRCSMNFP